MRGTERPYGKEEPLRISVSPSFLTHLQVVMVMRDAILLLLAVKVSAMSPYSVPESGRVCGPEEFCGKGFCRTPTEFTCKEQSNCGSDETCCPLIKMCVKTGAPCGPGSCSSGSYCGCPGKAAGLPPAECICALPQRPGVLCSANESGTNSPCWADEVCCPLTHTCVKAGPMCIPP